MTSSTNDERSMWGWFMRARSMNVTYGDQLAAFVSAEKVTNCTVNTVHTKHSVQNRCKR